MIMKKLLLMMMCAFLMSTSVNAWIQVPLTVSYDDERKIGLGGPKSLIDPPTVYIEDYTLLFEANHLEYVLNIKDEDGDVVYTTVVYSAQTQVVLPSTLSGDYVIELAMGNWLFTGWINL